MGHRRQRVEDELLAFLAEQIRRMRDPRLELVTLTGIEVTKDLKYASIFWSAPSRQGDLTGYPEEGEVRDIDKALLGAGGLLKKRIGDELRLRCIPELKFKYDSSLATGARIDQLLNEVKR